jgi:carnosine N-methyltransferase
METEQKDRHEHEHDHNSHDHHEHGEEPELSEDQKEAEHFCDVIAHFENYGSNCFAKFQQMEKDFNSLDPRFRAMIPNLEHKLEAVRKCVVINHAFIRTIVAQREVFHTPGTNYTALSAVPRLLKEDRMSKVRSTLRQCVRDWSSNGAEERAQCYTPILRELERLYPNAAERSTRRVLIPGSGLGRLTWEIAQRGFFSQGNEFSYYMLLCSYYILNVITGTNQVMLFPWITETKNLVKVADQTQSVMIPDVDPTSLPPRSQFSMVAGDFEEVFKDQVNLWDCVASCFFLDTAHNVLNYLKIISDILKPGGYFINFGPLLYHFADTYGELSIELSWEEIKSILPQFGLELIHEETGLPSVYTGHPTSMLQQTYRCVFFTCKKVTTNGHV